MKLAPVRRFRELLARPGLIRSLGAHDVFSALIMEQAGFDMVFLGGFGASASLLGLPDLNFLTMTEMADAVRRTAARLTVPLIADGDTGHGELHLRGGGCGGHHHRRSGDAETLWALRP
jgi:2-methylisocitrate lyase-like PEP mutase family enzyme